MNNFIGSPSRPFQFANRQICREEASPYFHDYHDPPDLARRGFHDAKSPPRRLAEVARSDPWRTPPAGVVFPRDATRRERLPWVVGFDFWNNSRGKDCLRRGLRGEDCHPEMEFCPVAGLRATKVALQPRGFVLVQDDLASFCDRARTSSWSLWFNFLNASTSLYSRVSGAALLAMGRASGSLSPSRISWYVLTSRAFAILSRVSRLGTVCPFSTLER